MTITRTIGKTTFEFNLTEDELEKAHTEYYNTVTGADSKYFTLVQWSNEDLESALEHECYPTTPKNIRALREDLYHFEDSLIDVGWQNIYASINWLGRNHMLDENEDFIRVTVYCDSTPLFSPEEIEWDNLCDLIFPKKLVRDFYRDKWEGGNIDVDFDEWLDNYTADDTDGLYAYCVRNGFTAQRDLACDINREDWLKFVDGDEGDAE